MISVIFIHGLNTYGDDDLHLGPVRLGKMSAPWEHELRARGCDVLALHGFGTGPIWDVAEQARHIITQHAWIKNKTNIHLIGHSTGGLLARALAAHPKLTNKTRSIITIGTPHHGTDIATQGLYFVKEHPRLQQLLGILGYDTKTKKSAFAQFTPEALREFNQKCQIPPRVKSAYALCEISVPEMSWPLRFLHSLVLQANESMISRPASSDGFILSTSQAWGEKLGTFQLDHFGNLGFFYQMRPSARQHHRAEFQRLVDATANWVKQFANAQNVSI